MRVRGRSAALALAALVIGSTVACGDAERDAAGGAEATTAGVSASGRESGATRAARALRPASALHVLRAPATPRGALEPLPESLVVELFAPGGRWAGGGTGLWRVVAGGGGVSPARSTTDSAGRAAASWTPGPSAAAICDSSHGRSYGPVILR